MLNLPSNPLLSITSDLLIEMKDTDQVTEVRILMDKITQFAFCMRKRFEMIVVNNCDDATLLLALFIHNIFSTFHSCENNFFQIFVKL